MFSVHRIYLVAAVFAMTVSANGADIVRSPDGNIRVTIEPSVHGHEVPAWSLSFHGKVLFTNCDLSLEIAGHGDWFRNSRLIGKRTAKHSETIPVHFGKSSSAQNHYEELRLKFVSAGGQNVDAVFRCYNDA